MQQFNGRRVKAARVLAGLRREDVAERTGVNIGTLAEWERGQRQPHTRFLGSLAHSLGVRVDELFDDVEVPA